MSEGEIHIAPRLYYTFLIGIAAIAVIIIETIIGEFIDNTVGVGGYVGASIIAVSVAAILYPVHKRTRKHVDFERVATKNRAAVDAISVGKEIVRALSSNIKFVLRYWYFFVPLIINAVYYMQWVIRDGDSLY